MSDKILAIQNLHVSAEETPILKGIDVTFLPGQTYALIGPNGNGKSTLLSSLMGDYKLSINQGTITYNGEDITTLETYERAKKGLYLLMQHPQSIKGVKLIDLIKSAKENISGQKISLLEVYAEALAIAKELNIDPKIIEREVNVGFSGGEKKKAELLQMLILNPRIFLLDEIDSGLDVDSIKLIAAAIKKRKGGDRIIVIVSHYKTLYEIIEPDETLIIKEGKIAQTGDFQLLMNTLSKGFHD